MELLAPAGTMENFMAALEAGADAIYLGGKVFNARSHAGNFDYEELELATKYAHILEVSIFVTVNIIVGDKELQALRTHLERLATIGVDGIIVQDLAVAALAKEYTPTLEIHGSTQMTATNLGTVRYLESLGFNRVVLSRELSLEEIRRICKEAKAEIEVFIHGALCIAYSGQCLMSSFIGGRSGNRGSCAQPCRLPYELVELQDGVEGRRVTKENEAYIMSPKDLNYSAHMGELIEAGVSSFKVEGRMKQVSYVKEVIGTYRNIIDQAGQASQKDRKRLESGFNRGFSTAYLEGDSRKEMMTLVAPNNKGKLVGSVQKQGKHWHLSLLEELQEGDMLKVISSHGDIEYFPWDASWQLVDELNYRSSQGQLVEGDVYKTNYEKTYKLRGLQDFGRKHVVYGYLQGHIGEQASLTLMLEDGHSITVDSNYVVSAARTQPTSLEKCLEQVGRMGNTLFTLHSLSMPEEGAMWPTSVLNQLRRDGIAALEALCLEAHKERREERLAPWKSYVAEQPVKEIGFQQEESLEKETAVSAHVDELWQVKVAIASGAKKIVFGGDRLQRKPYGLSIYEEVSRCCKNQGVWLTFALPRIVRESEMDRFYPHVQAMVAAEPNSISVPFLGAIAWLEQIGYTGAIEGDASLQIFNSQAIDTLHRMGCSSTVVSQEATLEQIQGMARHGAMPVECIVQGQTELMISEYCAISSFVGTGKKEGCPAPCLQGQYGLKDRKGVIFPIRTDPYCRMHIMNSCELDMRSYVPQLVKAGIAWLRVDCRQREQQWIEDRLSSYVKLLDGSEAPPKKNAYEGITRGHYFKGIF